MFFCDLDYLEHNIFYENAYFLVSGVFFILGPPKLKLKFGKPRLVESTLTYIVLDTPT